MNENPNAGPGPLLHADFGAPWSAPRWALLVVSLSIYYVAISAFLGRDAGRPQSAALVKPEAAAAESNTVAALTSEEDGCGCAEGCLVMNPTAPSKAVHSAARHSARTAPVEAPARRSVGLVASR